MLHPERVWKDAVNGMIVSGLLRVAALVEWDRSEGGDRSDDSVRLAFGALAVIGRVDERMYVGGNVIRNAEMPLHPDEKGTIINVSPSNLVTVYFYDDTKG